MHIYNYYYYIKCQGAERKPEKLVRKWTIKRRKTGQLSNQNTDFIF